MPIPTQLRAGTHRLFQAAPTILAVFVVYAPFAFAVERVGSRPQNKALSPSSLTFTTATGPASLIQCLLSPAIQFRNATLTGADGTAGTFSGGTGILGIEDGVALGTGLITDAVGPNEESGAGTDHGAAGDVDLNGLIDPEPTYDATVLEFEFFTDQPRTIEFQYVFASEEYSEFVGAGYDDVVAFFLNGTAATNNIARVPTGCGTVAGVPVSVDNVNCGNAGDPQVTPTNCGCYVDNEILTPPPPPPPYDTEMDGMTQVFTATGTSITGWNKLKIAIADAGDGILDSNVFIRCQSFTVPVRKSSWGEIKNRYR
jgi:hypothetical protein